MLHWLLKKRYKTNTSPYEFHQGMEYHSDAEEMVFNRAFTDPVLMHSGTGQIAGSLMVTQPPQLFFNPQSIKTGMPTIAGAFTLQPLIGDNLNGV